MKKITIYSDGACSGNPGPGGYGVILKFNEIEKELSGGFRNTTNNRMEIMGAIVGLEALKEPCEVTVVTDSQYLVNAIEKGWARKWRSKGWMRNNKERA
ncbi:MAG: ribonuclease HI, partial [Fibrobacter sp.]|nr:ribonuclease HI [Fibrobacter sp.]